MTIVEYARLHLLLAWRRTVREMGRECRHHRQNNAGDGEIDGDEDGNDNSHIISDYSYNDDNNNDEEKEIQKPEAREARHIARWVWQNVSKFESVIRDPARKEAVAESLSTEPACYAKANGQ